MNPSVSLLAAGIAATVLGCTGALSLPRLSEIAVRARAALAAGDTRALFEVSRDVYRQHGVDFDSGLTLHTHGPKTLSSFYLEDANQIVLARAARPGRPLLQVRALATALFYAAREIPAAGTPEEERRSLVNWTVLLLAAHEQAHYLRAQYFRARSQHDHWQSEATCNRLAAAVAQSLAAADPVLRAGLGRARLFYRYLLERAPPAVAAYPPPGQTAAAWFNRHYALLLRHEPGVYFLFQLRWWVKYLSAPDPLGQLIEDEILRAAEDYLAAVVPASGRVRVRTLRHITGRTPSELLALGPDGEALIDAEGQLLRSRDSERIYRARGLPYGEGYISNYATWPGGRRIYAFRWTEGSLELFAVDLDDARREARAHRLAVFAVRERFTTLSHDPQGALYLLARTARELRLYRVEPHRPEVVLVRRLPARPPGHTDGPVESATFEIGSFTVSAHGALIFFDPSSYAIRQIDEAGQVTTLAGSLRGHRDGSGETARLARVSHLAAFDDGVYFVEQAPGSLSLRRLEVRTPWREP